MVTGSAPFVISLYPSCWVHYLVIDILFTTFHWPRPFIFNQYIHEIYFTFFISCKQSFKYSWIKEETTFCLNRTNRTRSFLTLTLLVSPAKAPEDKQSSVKCGYRTTSRSQADLNDPSVTSSLSKHLHCSWRELQHKVQKNAKVKIVSVTVLLSVHFFFL